MSSQSIDLAIESAGASSSRLADIFWTLGASVVSLGLSPLVAFYVLLVG
jgi:hypothetical protein